MSEANVQIVITAVNSATATIQTLIGDLSKVSAQLQGIVPPAKGAGDALGGLGGQKGGLDGIASSVTGIASAATLAGNAVKFMAGGFLAMQGLGLVKGFADAAARTETLGVVLNVVGKNAGITHTELDRTDKKIQALGITAAASRESLTKFIQSGLNVADASRLARAAQDLAVVAGENSSATFARLILNIQQGDVHGLAWMGLVVDMSEATKRYAEAHNKTADSLSGTEKKQALLNEVLRKSVDLQGTYEASMSTVGKQLGSLERIQDTLAASMGVQLLPAYLTFVQSMQEVLKNLTLVSDEAGKQTDAAYALADAVHTIVTSLVELSKWLKDNAESVASLTKVVVILGEAWVALRVLRWAGLFIDAIAVVPVLTTLISGGLIPALGALRVALLAVPLVGWVVALGLAFEFIPGVSNGVRILAGSVQLLLLGWNALINPFQTLDTKARLISETSARLHKDWEALTSLFNGGAPASIANTTGKMAELIASMDKHTVKIKELSLAKVEADAAGNEALSARLDKELSAEKTAKAALEMEAEVLASRKETSAADKKMMQDREEANAKVQLALKKTAADAKELQDAEKRLKISGEDLVIVNGKMYSASFTADMAAYTLKSKALMDSIHSGGDGAKDALIRLREALLNLTKGAKTEDDLDKVAALVRSIRAEAEVPISVTAPAQEEVDSKRLAAEAKAKAAYEKRIAERKQVAAELASSEEAAIANRGKIEKVQIDHEIAALKKKYGEGVIGVTSYYAAVSAAQAKEAANEELLSAAKLKNLQAKMTLDKDPHYRKGVELEIANLIAGRKVNQFKADYDAAKILEQQADDIERKRKEGDAAHAASVQAEIAQRAAMLDLATAAVNVAQGKGAITSMEAQNQKRILHEADMAVAVSKVNASLDEQLRLETEVANAKPEQKAAALDALEAQRLKTIQLTTATINLAGSFETVGDSIRKNFTDSAATGIEALINRTKTLKQALLGIKDDIVHNLNKMAAKELSEQITKVVVSSTGGAGNSIFDKIGSMLLGGGKRDGSSEQSALIVEIAGKSKTLMGAVTGAQPGGITKSVLDGVFEVTPGAKKKAEASGEEIAGSISEAASDKAYKDAAEIASGQGGFGALFDSITGGFKGILDSVSGMFSGGGGGSGGGLGGMFSGAMDWFDGLFMAEGGYISGPGTGTSDSVPIMASHGEYVMPSVATAMYLPLLEAMRSGGLNGLVSTVRVPHTPYFAGGGLVDIPTLSGGSAPTTSITVVQQITTPDANSFRKSQDQIAAESGSAVNRAMKRNR